MRFKKMVCAVMMAGLLAMPLVAFSGDPDMPGVTQQDNYSERCFYVGDVASCLMAFWDWFMDQSLI